MIASPRNVCFFQGRSQNFKMGGALWKLIIMITEESEMGIADHEPGKQERTFKEFMGGMSPPVNISF